jgi:hypothetical protein
MGTPAVRVLLGLALATAGDGMAFSADCPLDAQNGLKNGYTWNVSTAQLAIARCKAQPVPLT